VYISAAPAILDFLNAGLQQQAAVLPAHSSDIPVFTAVGHVIIYPNMQAAIKVY